MVIRLLLATLVSGFGVNDGAWLLPVTTGGLTRTGSLLNTGTLFFGAASATVSLRPWWRTVSPSGENLVTAAEVGVTFAPVPWVLTPGPRPVAATAGGFLGNCGRTTAIVEPDVSTRSGLDLLATLSGCSRTVARGIFVRVARAT